MAKQLQFDVSAEDMVKLSKQFNQLSQRVATGSLDLATVRRALQDLIETKSPAAENVRVCEGVELTEEFLAQTRVHYGNQTLKRHRNGGGWVPAIQSLNDTRMPFVAESVYVGPHAGVVGNARAFHNVRIQGYGLLGENAKAANDVVIEGAVMGDAIVVGRLHVHSDRWISRGNHG